MKRGGFLSLPPEPMFGIRVKRSPDRSWVLLARFASEGKRPFVGCRWWGGRR